jgi:hypothetical protein
MDWLFEIRSGTNWEEMHMGGRGQSRVKIPFQRRLFSYQAMALKIALTVELCYSAQGQYGRHATGDDEV